MSRGGTYEFEDGDVPAVDVTSEQGLDVDGALGVSGHGGGETELGDIGGYDGAVHEERD
jgi:hypothetical protein